jgi:hypothetical protein
VNDEFAAALADRPPGRFRRADHVYVACCLVREFGRPETQPRDGRSCDRRGRDAIDDSGRNASHTHAHAPDPTGGV